MLCNVFKVQFIALLDIVVGNAVPSVPYDALEESVKLKFEAIVRKNATEAAP